MKSYIHVVRLLIKNLLRFDKGKKTTTIIIIASLGSLYAAVEAGLIYATVQLAPVFVALDILNEFIALLFTVSAIIVAIFGIVSLLSLLYFSRDTEFFLSLPVKPQAVFAAKFTVVYATELMLTVALLLPVVITLGIVTGMTAAFYPIMVVGVLIAPSIPLVLASLVAVPLMYVVGFFKNKGALTSIVVIVLFGGVFAASMYIQFSMQFSTDDMVIDPMEIVMQFRGMFISVANVVYPYLSLARLATLSSSFGLSPLASFFVNFALSVGIIAALVALSVFVSGLVYARGAAAQLESPKHESTGKERYVQSGILKTLVVKEWRNIIRTPSFAYSCLLVVVFSPIMMFLFSFTMRGAGGEFIEFLQLPYINWVLYITLMSMCVGMNVTPACSFTREGKNFYMLKTLPVDAKTQIRAKNILSLIIVAVGMFLSSLVPLINDFNPLLWLMSLTILMAYAHGYNCAATLFDLRKPKLDWTTPNEAMKTNLNVAVPTFINMGISIIPLVGGMLLYSVFPNIWSLVIVLGSMGLLAAVLVTVFPYLLYKNVQEKFEKVE